jgi:methylphosphotriester-DNA--protein-cysteine methyltransferase
MRDQRSNPGVPADRPGHRTCERCGQSKPPSEFTNPEASVCRRCRRLARFSKAARRAATAHLIAAHQAEHEALLRAEQAKQGLPPTDPPGGSGVA